jgi:hypothetical protein
MEGALKATRGELWMLRGIAVVGVVVCLLLLPAQVAPVWRGALSVLIGFSGAFIVGWLLRVPLNYGPLPKRERRRGPES